MSVVVRTLRCVGCGLIVATVLALLLPAAAAADEVEAIVAARSGAEIYATICQGCHMPDGRGATGAGSYPALAGNPRLASAGYMAMVILHGQRNMPAFGSQTQQFFFAPTFLHAQEVANVINHVRTHFGNRYTDPISAADVAALQPTP